NVIRQWSFVNGKFRTDNNPLNLSNDQCPMTNDCFYKTGDLARWLPEGIVEFLGRSDHQVKVRGIRVELNEIENTLLKHSQIKEAVVIDRKDEKSEIYLCAYIVPSSPGIDEAEIREFLAALLPRNMIPANFIFIEKIPLTAVGKINRKALPEPIYVANEDLVDPVNKIEKFLLETWSYVLSLEKEKIGRHSNFFALGGHSLKATVLQAKIHKELEVKIPLAELFKNPTIVGLAKYIQDAQEEVFFAVEAVEEREYYPLSSVQRRIYLLQQMDLNSIVYNMPLIMKFDMEIDINKLGQMMRQLVQRHESFRTSFQNVNEEPVQRVHSKVEIPIECYESVNIEKDNALSVFISKFDLAQAPLLRVKVIKLAENKTILIIDMHHIISDGFSMDILMREFPDLYEGKQLPGLRIQYKDYTYWQNSEAAKAKIKDQEAFWINEFRGDIPILDLPIDYPRPLVQSFVGSFFNFTFTHEETLLLKKAALEKGVTLYLLLLTIFNILLYRLSGQEDIVLGTPIAGRRHADLQAIVGMFVNTLLLRNFPPGKQTFGEFLEEVKIRTLRAFENQDYPFEDLVEKIAVGRDPGRNPLFDVMFTWQDQKNQQDDSVSRLYEGHVSRFDMTWSTSERNNCINLGIEYCTDLFKQETIERFAIYFNKIISNIIVDPSVRISDIDIITNDEKKQVLYDFNCTYTEYPRNKTIPQLFAQQVERTPDRMAILYHGQTRGDIDDDNMVTYRLLDEKSIRLSEILIEKGVLPDSIVGIISGRSIDMIICILGILRAGGAYLPIASDYPEERINYMLKDSGSAILLTNFEKEKINNCQLTIVNSQLSMSGCPRRRPQHSNHLAYIMYTSGSTGKPKGVMVEHGHVIRLVKNTNYLEFRENERLLQTGALEFDASTFEIWGALLNGMTLCLCAKVDILNPIKLKENIQKYNFETIFLTTALFSQLSVVDIDTFPGLKNLLVGGEMMPPQHMNRLVRAKFPGLKIIHCYGPTENTTFSTTFTITQEYNERIPIGRPIANSTAYVVDKVGHLVPVGVCGELLLGGEGVSRGYLNNPELTAERFKRNVIRQWSFVNGKFRTDNNPLNLSND
ncbi:MAG: condensation domain-containing protein, partial [Acidobacteria bacterium]|nr:condensation domain-containing protein [Acidobacteriota bacterium]